jgi:hypothetical protein
MPSSSLQCALLALLPVILCFSAAARSAPRQLASQTNHCKLDSWVYRPSKLETLWTDNVKEWSGDDYCSFVDKFQDNITYWLETNAKLVSEAPSRVIGVLHEWRNDCPAADAFGQDPRPRAFWRT